MRAFEIFRTISPSLGDEIIRSLREHQREVYRAALATLAQQKKLRPQFVQKKTTDQQITWILETLKFKTSDTVAEQILQVWLMKQQSPMLVQFLDAVDVGHDGAGAVDDLPKELETDKVKTAIDGLLGNFPAESVAVYLQIFQLQQPGGWPAVAEVLAQDPRLQVGVGTVEAGVKSVE